MIRRRSLMAPALLAAATLVACGSTPKRPPPAAASPQPGSLVIGVSGGDYGAPIYQEVGSLLKRQGVTLNYRIDGLAIGSSRLETKAGPAVLASEYSEAMTNLPQAGDSSELYVPVAFGAVAVIYNLPGLHAPLRLEGRTLADIFLGRVRNWSARAIARSNRDVKLPNLPITVIHRIDPTAVTDLLTRYLAKSLRRWRRGPGTGATVSWPTGTSESSDATLLATLAQTPGAIGYTDQSTALQDHLRVVRLRNAMGQWVAPTLHATTAVGLQSRDRGALSLSTLNARVRGAYPLVTEAYMLTAHDLCDAGFSHEQASGVQRVLRYMLGAGQDVAQRLSFAPLPPGLRASARTAVSRLRCGGQVI